MQEIISMLRPMRLLFFYISVLIYSITQRLYCFCFPLFQGRWSLVKIELTEPVNRPFWKVDLTYRPNSYLVNHDDALLALNV